MNATLKATNAGGLTTKLQKMGFEKFHGGDAVGFGVHTDFRGIVCLVVRGYSESNVVEELREAGYLVEDVNRWVEDFKGLHLLTCTVVGRVAA